MNSNERKDSHTLEILQAIEEKSDVTQRHLANHLGVALGLANTYLKRCVRKGLIKIHQAPANRYMYYLTPKGFAEKSRLTAEYLSTSFNYYRDASESISSLYKQCEEKSWKSILFCGVSELSEIASIRAKEHDLTIIGTWDPNSKKKIFLELPVWQTLIDTPAFNACLLTSLSNAEQLIDDLIVTVNPEKIMIPSILGVREVIK